MTVDDYNDAELFSRPRQRHLVAGCAAVLLSLLLHGLALQHLPALPVGRPPAMDTDDRYRPMVLGDVRQRMIENLERPDRFRPEDPALASMDAVSLDSFKSLMEELVPPEPVEMGVVLSGEGEALVQPDAHMQRERWDPRADIVQIRDTIVPDEISALPRRYVADVERSSMVPDITLPTDSPQLAMLARGEGLSSAWSAQSAVPGMEGRAGLTPTLRLEPDRDADGLHVAEDAPDLFQEAPDAISSVAPIENLLRMQLETFADPSDTGFVYFKMTIERAGAEALPVLPKDMLIIQDASRSMTQRKLDAAKKGIHRWLQLLSPGDRFDVVRFNDSTERAFGQWAPYNAVNQSRAALFVESMRAQGGTDVFESLQPLNQLPLESGRPVIAILISDGVPTTGIVDSTDIIEQFSRANAGRVSVFAVGAGPSINRYLLDFISYKNRGDSIMTDHTEAITSNIEQLAIQLQRPVLMDLRYRFTGVSGLEAYPQALTHLYLDRPLSIYGRAPLTRNEWVIQVIGQSGADSKDMLFPVRFTDAQPGGAHIRTEWAWQKVYHLIGSHIQTRQPETLESIRRMSAEYGLRVLYGSDVVPRRF